MAEDTYLRLFHELIASRFESEAANAAIEQLGPPARVLRSLARARRHAWASARADLVAAVDGPHERAALVEFVAGVALYVARDYDRALSTLLRAAERGKPGIAKQARSYALRFAQNLGWNQRVRELEALLSPAGPRSRLAEASAPDADDPRAAAASAYATLFDSGPSTAAAALNALLARHPEHPSVIAALARLELLRNQFEAARARLSALTPALREALAGELAALALADGDAEQALIQTADDHDDPRLLYLRARALVALDDTPEANREASELLERARCELPESVAIGLALALSRHREAPETFSEGLERRFEALLEWAPGLLADAAAAAAIELWTDNGPLADRDDKVTILARAQQMLSAEADLVRSSYRSGLRLRHVAPSSTPASGAQASHLERLHADDRALLEYIDTTLVRAIGVKPPRPIAPGVDIASTSFSPKRVWQPRYLSPAQIEQFIVDGFLIVPQAFDPELARAWREDANRRLRDEPEQWVRGYDPTNEAMSLRDYSPDDPSTWTWGRLDLDGPKSVVIEEFAPTAWAAICDLLGGPDRIKTRSWKNYLIINFCADQHLGIDAPEPDWDSWHIDNPSPMMRLDQIQNGLIGVACFSRLLPRSGNTWLAPDSVARVARELAAHPEGIDFVADRGNRITTQCERFHEVVGEVGDLLLMHPLMMHSTSPNRSGRIRWMGNPMVELNAPLDPFRPVAELSPVELAIHRAITSGDQ